MGMIKNIKKMFSALKTKQGQMAQNPWIEVVGGLGLGVLLLAVIAIILQAFGDSQVADSFAKNITLDGLTFVDNATSQLGTAGTVAGVSVLLLILALFGIYGYSKYKQAR